MELCLYTCHSNKQQHWRPESE